MSATSGHLSKLVDLAQERSSEKRRELLHELSELFIDSPDLLGDEGARDVADDILVTLAHDMESSVRAALAEKFADSGDAPAGLVNDLARDVFAVARPLLERSSQVSEETLLHAVRAHGGDHASVVAARADVSAAVAEAVVDTKHDAALVALAGNARAELSRDTMEKLVDHAETCIPLHAPLVERKEIAPDLMNELFFVVEEKLRERIVERNAALDESQLEAAMSAVRNRMARKKQPGLPSDYEDAMRFVTSKKLRKKLDTRLLAELSLNSETTKLTVAFADLASITYAAARRVLENPAVDPLAIACKSAQFSRDDFLRIATLRSTTAAREEADSDTLGRIYDDLSEQAASRVMRFVKLRDPGANAA